MIRIRPGRSWRLNPGYLGELRALTAPRARGFNGSEILDVLGLEVDGVDIAAGVGEAQVLVAVDELVQALLALGEGSPAAQATIGPGPTELVLEARGPDVLLTLASLSPPARLLASGLLIDATRLRGAALAAARSLLLDLLAISSVLEKTPLAKRLAAGCSALAKRPTRARTGWPSVDGARAIAVKASGTGGVRCEISAPVETMARVAARAEAPGAPLAVHLGRGTVTLRVKDAPALSCEEPLLFTLRNLVREAAALVEAWEAGDRAFTLPLGALELRCDLTRDEVRAPGWKHAWEASPAQLASALATAAHTFAERALRTGGKAPDELLSDLRSRARELLRHCKDLSSGDLRRAPGLVSAPAPSAAARPLQAPLSRGRIRRLAYREIFREPIAALVGAPLLLPQGPLVLRFADALEARDASSGARLWRLAASPGALARGHDLFFAEPGDALVRLDATSGEVRWRRRMGFSQHPARLWPAPNGVLRALPGEGLALVLDGGTLAFRARLPGGAPTALVAADGVIVAALASGSLAGLDPTDGRVLWKRRCKVSALVPSGSRALVLSPGALAAVDAATGEPAWEHPLQAVSTGPVIAADAVLAIADGAVQALGLADGAPRFSRPLPWASQLAVADEPDEHGHRGSTVIATGAGGEAMRLDERGAAKWALDADGQGPAKPALIERGVVLLSRGQTALHSAAEGLLLGQLPQADAAALAPDLTCAMVSGGELSLHRLATHLSVV